MPASSAPFSLPAAARVARPKRVYREIAPSTTVTSTTRAARSNRLVVTAVPSRWMGASESTWRFVCTAAPLVGNRNCTICCRYRNRPSDATTRARAGARRNGRKISVYTTRPSTAPSVSATTSAVASVGLASKWTRAGRPRIGSTRSPVPRSSKNANATYMPIAAVAKFTTPEAR